VLPEEALAKAEREIRDSHWHGLEQGLVSPPERIRIWNWFPDQADAELLDLWLIWRDGQHEKGVVFDATDGMFGGYDCFTGISEPVSLGFVGPTFLEAIESL
jgi:hypothetical protein